MSTILRALKQAEKESRQYTTPPSFDSGLNEVGSPKEATLFIPRRVILISLILFIGGISFVYLLSPSQEKAERPAPAPVQKKEITSLEEPPRPIVIKPLSPAPAPPRLPSPESMVKPAPKPPLTVEKTAPPTPPRPSTPEKSKAPPVPEPVFTPVTAKSSSTPEVPLLKDKSLKIQAISWDQDPTNRITVINNSILNEGDAIQGFQVLRIEKEAVLLNGNGRNYRLKFRYR
ncbi:general secretion pathway protein GspB [uncultured Desulfobacter sp.]|uniref:general secretion pathway protein GspB n=1 Tax=uncultured Desulfobacter sp. TaxID=240139 RepID=UPI0029F4F8C0|nr:general secretion pathway protein GspB [uncultured Desulfobacter sp.]